MIVKVHGEEKKCNLLIADDGLCQIFEDGKQTSTNIDPSNIKKIIIVTEE